MACVEKKLLCEEPGEAGPKLDAGFEGAERMNAGFSLSASEAKSFAPQEALGKIHLEDRREAKCRVPGLYPNGQ